MLRRLGGTDRWDFIVIGGGATGLGVAIEAASRGYQTVLLEQGDFSQGTSSRSTKLVHGGVRYLQQGNVSLVLEALKERGILYQNAPHLVHNLPFVVPNYDWWEGPYYGIGLKLYDMLAGRHGFGASRLLSRERTLELIPTLEPEGLRGGVIYHDGQFDDARLAINMAETAAEQGAAVLNYMEVTALSKSGGEVHGVSARDLESGVSYVLEAGAVINATGVWTDTIRRMDDPDVRPMVKASQGVHVVLDRSFLPGDSAIMIPHTDDGRVLFAIPWHDRVLIGTTDTPVDGPSVEPAPFVEEVAFLLKHAARYLTKDPRAEDVLSLFAGLRPLVSSGHDEHTSEISRDHTLHIAPSGLVTITGGKWTTYRKMAQDTIDQAATLAGLADQPSVTADLPIHGFHRKAEIFGPLAAYGSDAVHIQDLQRERPELAEPLHPRLPYTGAEIVFCVRHEMARTLTDVLSRRTRALLLDARASIEVAPRVAGLMAQEQGHDDGWIAEQVQSYTDLADAYVLA